MEESFVTIKGIGEYGFDTETSKYYVKLYDGSHDIRGLETEREARDTFECLIERLDF